MRLFLISSHFNISWRLISPNSLRKHCKIGPEKPQGECPITCNYNYISNNTKQNVEIKFWVSHKTLESTGETNRNWWLNFTCVSTISLNFEIYFSRSYGKLFLVSFQAIYARLTWLISYVSSGKVGPLTCLFQPAPSLAAVTASLRVAKTHLLPLSFYSSSPCHFRPSSGPLPFWCPG